MATSASLAVPNSLIRLQSTAKAPIGANVWGRLLALLNSRTFRLSYGSAGGGRHTGSCVRRAPPSCGRSAVAAKWASSGGVVVLVRWSRAPTRTLALAWGHPRPARGQRGDDSCPSPTARSMSRSLTQCPCRRPSRRNGSCTTSRSASSRDAASKVINPPDLSPNDPPRYWRSPRPAGRRRAGLRPSRSAQAHPS